MLQSVTGVLAPVMILMVPIKVFCVVVPFSQVKIVSIIVRWSLVAENGVGVVRSGANVIWFDLIILVLMHRT